LPFGRSNVVRAGSDITVVTWGAMVHRCAEAATRYGEGAVELIDLRTIAPWDKSRVLESVRKTGRCLIVHEDNLTAGFGAEIGATVAQDAFWSLDAPVERLAPKDIPVAYHEDLLGAMMPGVETIADRIQAVLNA
jgi:2-oxoisovalerate dehydrogenase E1 component